MCVRSFISISIVTAILLVLLVTLFLLWIPTPHRDVSATVINTTALADNKAPEPALVTESINATSAPAEITAAPPKDRVAIIPPPHQATEILTKFKPTTPPTPLNLTSLLHSQTNTAREQNNLSDLTFDARLGDLAKERSEEMINKNYFSHTSLNGCDLRCRFTNSNYETLTWGENLAQSTSYNMLSTQELANMFMESWLRSSGHKDNLLSKKFTHEGIGVAIKGNRVVVTVIFAAP